MSWPPSTPWPFVQLYLQKTLFLCEESRASACVSAPDVRSNLHSSYIIEAGRAASRVAQLSHDILLSNSRHTLVFPGHSSSSMGLTVANLWTVISLSQPSSLLPLMSEA